MFKKIISKLVYSYKSDSETFINYYRKKGAKIGKGCVVFEPTNVSIDISRPYLINIGDNVQITKGVTILTHGYDWSVIKGLDGNVLGNAKPVNIGNNVFIGRNATIMGNVTIGNNVIIGAGAIVTNNIPDNCVIAGVPAKVVSTIEAYYEKRLKVQEEEAQGLVRAYYSAFSKIPPKEELREFFGFLNQEKKESITKYLMML